MSPIQSSPSIQSNPTRRQLGRLLLDGAIISDGDLERALTEQKYTNQLLGQILIKLGVLDHNELSAVLAIQEDTAQLDDALKLAAGIRQHLGELLTDAKRLTAEQVVQALDEQTKTGEKLGDMLIRLGYLIPAERDTAVEFQRRQGGEGPTIDKLRLGRIMVTTGQISESQLNEALERTRTSGRRLGEELIAAGYLSSDVLDRALKLQRRLVNAALIAALYMTTGAYVGQAEAGQVRALMTVTATVVDSVSIRSVHQTQNLVITAQDVARGYVQVPAGSRFEIRNSGSCLFEFRAMGNIFRSVRVTGQDGTVEFGLAGGTMLKKSSGNELASVEFGYRFELAPGLGPGVYHWPLSLTVLPM